MYTLYHISMLLKLCKNGLLAGNFKKLYDARFVGIW